MPTLLQSIQTMIDNVSVTDRQEESIKTSTNNLTNNLTNSDSNLYVDETFVNGSYERDTILRPLDDIDLFAVLNKEEWEDNFKRLPTPEKVLRKMKDYLNSLSEYEGKVSQDRPCVTVKLNDKNFDIMPSFENIVSGYLIPDETLQNWIIATPKELTKQLNSAHSQFNYKLKSIVKAIKYWNRENDKLIPSYHIEETLISLFSGKDFTNYEEAIRLWFNEVEFYLHREKFKTDKKYDKSIENIREIKVKLNDAKDFLDANEEAECKKIWKEIFGKEFPLSDIEEAKNFGSLLSKGGLKIGSTGIISETVGRNIPASKGFYGDL